MKYSRFVVLGAVLSGALVGCASETPYIRSTIDSAIEVEQSEVNRITSVSTLREDDELVIFGDVEPLYTFCRSCPLVELSIERDGEEAERFFIPIVDRGHRRPGWYGASFRARLPLRGVMPQRLRFTLRDSQCFAGYCLRQDQLEMATP